MRPAQPARADDALEDEQADQQCCHLEVRVGNVPVGVRPRDEPPLNVFGPFDPPDNGGELAVAGQPHAAAAVRAWGI